MGYGITGLVTELSAGVTVFLLIATAVLSYFLGCLNGAVIVSKYILQDDVRDHGSGNAGLTNFYRTFGGKLTFAVIAADMMKMVIAVFISSVLCSTVLVAVPIFIRFWAGLFCALGHMFPCMFQFRGGKGILSGGTLALLLDWRITLVVWGIFIILVAVTKLVSLGSCVASVLFPIMSVIIFPAPSVFLCALCVTALILWQHRGNIVRILHGEESKFSFQRKQVKP
ncbi:MAG: acyl-phosphate glycerol 3-phosphate acyltransferase [Firmicutes bacterium]|nr:acyl-phosphate glycerol 3-phosphate acyltransferase [Bacillota bacterium]